MNTPRPLSGVFVPTSIPSPTRKTTKRPKVLGGSSYPTEARRREEITRSFCGKPGASFRRCSPTPTPAEPLSPPMQQRSTTGLNRAAQCRPKSPRGVRTSLPPSRIPVPRLRTLESKPTFDAIDGALRAVQSVLMKTRLAAGDGGSSPTVSEDLESLCGTECTESTVCSSSLSSEDCSDSGRRLSASLRDARRTLKERIGAEERSVRFTRGLLAKLDEFRVAVVTEDSSNKA